MPPDAPAELWITIPNWGKFQHYKKRNPAWIKIYTELNSDPNWDKLTLHQRGLLVTIWIEYARSRGQVGTDVVRMWCGRGFKVETLKRLSDAGFIELSASKPLALRYTRVVLRTTQEGASKNGAAPSTEEPLPAEPPRDPEALKKIHELAAQIGLEP